MKQLLVFLCLVSLNSRVWGAVGDTFTASTTEGVSITYKVLSEEDKTCETIEQASLPSGATITIPSQVNGYTVIGIGYRTFREFAVKLVKLPSTITYIGNEAFESCSSLTSVTIPVNVELIDRQAFKDCSLLETIFIPASVKTIGLEAFRRCTKLERVVMNEGVEVLLSGVFLDCTALSTIVIPSTITSVEANTFTGTAWYSNLPEGLTYIGQIAYRYKNSSSTTSVSIKNGTTLIAPSAFYGTNISSVTIPNSVTKIGGSAFYGCTNLSDITIPNSVTIIDDFAFSGTSITGVQIPSTTKTIGNSVFENCKSLQIANLSSLEIESMGNSVFKGCSELINIGLPNSLKYVSKETFSGCTSLPSLRIPSYVRSIGDRAFQSCSNITSISLPDSVSSVGEYTFYGCESLTAINLPSKITRIESGAFWGCKSLASIRLHYGIYYLGHQAFSGCQSLQEITIPGSLRQVYNSWDPAYVFIGCSGLTKITIKEGATTLGIDTFGTHPNLKEIVCWVKKPLPIDDYMFDVHSYNAILYVPKGSKTAYQEATGWKKFKEIVELDEDLISFRDEEVESICLNQWDTNKDGFISIQEAQAVTSLGKTFRSNSKIVRFQELQYFTGLTNIGSDAFEHCTNLKYIILPQTISSIGKQAFRNNAIISLDIPESVKSIGYEAFNGCRNLKSIVLPSGVSAISSMTFYDCSNLTSVTIPNSVTSIGSSAFYGCSTLPSITIPTSVTNIGGSAFYNCSGLTSITIPASVKSIGNYAFNGCSFTAFICKATTPPTLGSNNAFDGKKNIYVPYVSIDAYKSAWSQLAEPTYSYYPLLDVMFFEKQTAESYAEEMKGKAKAGVTSVAFYEGGLDADLTEAVMKSGMNPNCLYYVPADAGLSGDNIISLDSYEASKVSLTDYYPFDCPIPFHASEIEYVHNPSVWANGSAGWETICLPFAPHSYKASGRGYISPIMLGTKGNFWLRKYVGASSDAVYFSSTLDGKMEANTPYLVAFPGSTMGTGHLQGQTITFLGSNADIDVTQQPEVRNNDFVFVGNYDTTADGTEGWALNAAGSSFVKSGTVGDKPFCAYFKNMAGDAATSRLQISFNETTDIEGLKDYQSDFTVIDGGNGTLLVQTGSSRMLSIYKTDGRLERSIQLRAGENRIEGLNKGVYIIDNQKVLVR